MLTIPITTRIAIDESEVDYAFARASGPGGQNVNLITPNFDTLTKKFVGYVNYASLLIPINKLSEHPDRADTPACGGALWR